MWGCVAGHGIQRGQPHLKAEGMTTGFQQSSLAFAKSTGTLLLACACVLRGLSCVQAPDSCGGGAGGWVQRVWGLAQASEALPAGGA